MLRPVLSNAKARVAALMTGGFKSQADEDDFVKDYGNSAIDQVIYDTRTELGSVRVVSYSASTISNVEKTNIGAGKIADDLYDAYTASGSRVSHDGSIGKLVFDDETIYHLPCAGGNSDDFTNFQEMLEEYMAYLYINDVGTSAEKSAALSSYNDLKDDLS
jgi:hypothetical protein